MCGGKENKCHHVSLRHWETLTKDAGIRGKNQSPPSSFEKSLQTGERGSENEQKIKQEIERTGFVGHVWPTMCFRVIQRTTVDHCVPAGLLSASPHFHCRRSDRVKTAVHPRVAFFHFRIPLSESLGLPLTSAAVPEFTTLTMGVLVPSPLATQRIAPHGGENLTADALVSIRTTVCGSTS